MNRNRRALLSTLLTVLALAAATLGVARLTETRSAAATELAQSTSAILEDRAA